MKNERKKEKDLRKLKQRQAGGPQEDPVKSAKKALVEVHCTECAQKIRMTKRNVEALAHVKAKHEGIAFEQCFPGYTHE